MRMKSEIKKGFLMSTVTGNHWSRVRTILAPARRSCGNKLASARPFNPHFMSVDTGERKKSDIAPLLTLRRISRHDIQKHLCYPPEHPFRPESMDLEERSWVGNDAIK